MLENYDSSIAEHAVSCRVCHDPDGRVNVAMSAFFLSSPTFIDASLSAREKWREKPAVG
jgi:hypothetical protein